MPDIKVRRRTITLAEGMDQLFKSKYVGLATYMLPSMKNGRINLSLCLGVEPSSRAYILALSSNIMEAACTDQCTNKEVTDLHLKHDHKRVRQGNPR